MRLNGSMLKDLLDRKELTQAQAAAKFKISIQTLNNALNGRNLHMKTGVRICKKLQIRIEDAMVPRADTERGNAA